MPVNLSAAKNVDWTKTEAIAKAFAKQATKGDDAVNEIVTGLFLSMGLFDKEHMANDATPRDLKAPFLAFATNHWSAANKRKPLSEGTLPNYLSSFSVFYDIGRLPYDSRPFADFCIDKLKGGFSGRGATIRKMVAAFPTVAPTDEELIAMIPPSESESIRAMCTAFLKRIKKRVDKDVVMLRDYPVADMALADMMAHAQLAVNNLPKDDVVSEDLAAAAAAKRKALGL